MSKKRTLLLLGPLPPPVGGATRNVEIFLAEAAKIDWLEVIVVNSSPGDYRKQTKLLRLDTAARFWRILAGFMQNIGRCDAVLLLGRASLIFSLGSMLSLLNRRYQKIFYIKPFGGDFYERIHQYPLTFVIIRLLKSATGILAQTQEMTHKLRALGLPHVVYLPGYRPAAVEPPAFTTTEKETTTRPLNLLFVGQIKAEKGVFQLLESLQLLAAEGKISFTCDFYGPIFAADRPRFETQLQATPHTTYSGILALPELLPTMCRYDVLLFPTYHENEGHPGVLIEAMQVGLPVIATNFQTISELITDGENGLLIPVQDSRALAQAIQQLAVNPALRYKLGQNNYERRQQFDAQKVVKQMITTIFNLPE